MQWIPSDKLNFDKISNVNAIFYGWGIFSRAMGVILSKNFSKTNKIMMSKSVIFQIYIHEHGFLMGNVKFFWIKLDISFQMIFNYRFSWHCCILSEMCKKVANSDDYIVLLAASLIRNPSPLAPYPYTHKHSTCTQFEKCRYIWSIFSNFG